MNKITPFLWFDNQAEEAARFYVSLFKNSRILEVTPMITTFEVDGQRVMALNGGPNYKLTEAFSFFVDCENQDEVDELWTKLTADGGEESQCGWLKDKYGLSWQIIPRALMEMMGDQDPAKAKRVVDAMLQMQKIDTEILEQAYNQA
jgi:predicted 3-demethylubiquinone-9 3-methyltransferase (glyoxalase superfamily)